MRTMNCWAIIGSVTVLCCKHEEVSIMYFLIINSRYQASDKKLELNNKK